MLEIYQLILNAYAPLDIKPIEMIEKSNAIIEEIVSSNHNTPAITATLNYNFWLMIITLFATFALILSVVREKIRIYNHKIENLRIFILRSQKINYELFNVFLTTTEENFRRIKNATQLLCAAIDEETTIIDKQFQNLNNYIKDASIAIKDYQRIIEDFNTITGDVIIAFTQLQVQNVTNHITIPFTKIVQQQTEVFTNLREKFIKNSKPDNIQSYVRKYVEKNLRNIFTNNACNVFTLVMCSIIKENFDILTTPDIEMMSSLLLDNETIFPLEHFLLENFEIRQKNFSLTGCVDRDALAIENDVLNVMVNKICDNFEFKSQFVDAPSTGSVSNRGSVDYTAQNAAINAEIINLSVNP